MAMSASSAAFFCENFAGTVSVFAGASGTAKAPFTNAAFGCKRCSGFAGGEGCWAAASPTLPTTASPRVLARRTLRMAGSCRDEHYGSTAACGGKRNSALARAAAAVVRGLNRQARVLVSCGGSVLVSHLGDDDARRWIDQQQAVIDHHISVG